ncbi:MAG: tetratricopeptide repeat protein [Myxococcota bacterium]|nr:tetratricopeptide repeat protein [Myxococcota bacterium]
MHTNRLTRKPRTSPGRFTATLAIWLCVFVGAMPPSTSWGRSKPDLDLGGARHSPEADRVLRERTRPLLTNPAKSLRAAREAIAEGDRSHAVWILAQVAQRHPTVGDYAALMQVEVLVESGHSEAAVGVARSALLRQPDSRLRPRIHELLGRALYDTGNTEGAHAAWRAALDHSRDDSLRARVLLAIAMSEEEQGLTPEAATTYKLIWYAHPASEQARVAEHRLEVIEDYLGEPLRSGTDWRRRGDHLFRARQNEEALAAFQNARTLGLRGGESRRNERQIARTLFRLRRYPEATEAFAVLPQTEDVPIWRARSMARSGQVFEAIEEFERLADSNVNRQGIRARFLAGLLLDGRGHNARAEAHYRQVARSGQRAGLSDAAAWRLGWGAYRAGDYERANLYFDQLVRQKEGDPIGQLRPRYWHARALEHRGDARSLTEFSEIARDYPLSYYGWRARSRIGHDIPERLDRPAPRNRARRLTSAALARPRILIQAGLLQEAQEEIRILARQARSLEDRMALAQLATAAQDYNRAQRIVVEPYTATLARGPIRQHEDLWWYAWPTAYSNWVTDATAQGGALTPLWCLP